MFFGNGNRRSEAAVVVEGLRPLVQQRIQKDMFDNSIAKWAGDMVLVVDGPSTKIISCATGMYNLTKNRVYLVEDIMKKRAPYPKSAPIYFLTPTAESVDRLIDDWTPSRKKKEPLYADAIFLYFSRALSDELFSKIKACKPLLKRLKVFSELNMDFVADEIRAFHFDMKSCFAQLFRTTVSGPSPAEIAIADKLVTVCATLNEYPHVRYKVDSRVGNSIARLFNTKLTEFIGKNKTWWYHGDVNHLEKGRSTLLVLSRTDDPLSPLMHEFTYEAMVHDLLTVNNGKITYKASTVGTAADTGDGKGTMDKDALLNENDEVWVELRGMHIADVITTLSTKIRDIVESNTGTALNSKKGKSKNLSLDKMANALRALPEYREVMSKLSQHLNIAHQCMEIFSKDELLNLGELEQTLATGKTDEGRVPLVTDAVNQVEECLQKTPDSRKRFRLLSIFIVSQRGLKPSDQSRLFTAARLGPQEKKALSNLETVGIPLIQAMAGGRISSIMGNKLVPGNKASTLPSESEYAQCRYTCELKHILSEMANKSLDFDQYPSVFPMPEEAIDIRPGRSSGVVSSVRTKKGNFSSRVSVGDGKKFDGSRQIVFIAGGACHSELRAVKELMNKGGPEIIFGSTSFNSPTDFIHDLGSI